MPRATSPVAGVVLLAAVTVVAAAALGVAVPLSLPDPAPAADLHLRADADEDRLTLHHARGEPIDVRELRVRVRVDGEPLAHQPPVPFFAARGFVSGPTGPFNVAAEGPWRAGETAGLRLAETNRPLPSPGDRVEVTLRTDAGVVAELAATAT